MKVSKRSSTRPPAGSSRQVRQDFETSNLSCDDTRDASCSSPADKLFSLCKLQSTNFTYTFFLDHINTHSQIWLHVSQRVSWSHWTLHLQPTYLHSCTLHRSTQMKGELHWFLLQESDEHPTRRPCMLTWETPSRGWVSRGKYRPLMRTSLMQPADRKLWYQCNKIHMTLVFTSNSHWPVTDTHSKGGYILNKWNITDTRDIA